MPWMIRTAIFVARFMRAIRRGYNSLVTPIYEDRIEQHRQSVREAEGGHGSR